MPNAEQGFSIKMSLKILQYSWENTCVKLSRTTILENICLQLLLNWFYKVIIWNFLSGLQKYQLLLAHMPSINLPCRLSWEPRFCMFIINGSYTKSKRL